MLKIGHRGASGYEPENTLRSFAKAIEMKVDAIELDVYVCNSGELVVIHDDKVNRTTNGKGFVEKKDLEKLKTLYSDKGQKIPTLNEVLDLVSRRTIVNIELKGKFTAEPVYKLINQYIKEKQWQSEDFIISSFDRKELIRFRELDKINIFAVGLLVDGLPIKFTEFAKQIHAKYVNLSSKWIIKSVIEKAHKDGFQVLVWTVNTDKEIERMKKMGVDGMFSNFPDKI